MPSCKGPRQWRTGSAGAAGGAETGLQDGRVRGAGVSDSTGLQAGRGGCELPKSAAASGGPRGRTAHEAMSTHKQEEHLLL